MSKYGYVFIKHPKHYGEADELQKFLDEANEKGYVIETVVPGDGYITIIYNELYTDTPK